MQLSLVDLVNLIRFVEQTHSNSRQFEQVYMEACGDIEVASNGKCIYLNGGPSYSLQIGSQ